MRTAGFFAVRGDLSDRDPPDRDTPPPPERDPPSPLNREPSPGQRLPCGQKE